MRQLLQATFEKFTDVKPLDFSSTINNATILPLDIPIEEERAQDYNSKIFYPVKLGETFHDKYQVVWKVGFGANSTVWLTRNLRRFEDRYAVLKVCTSDVDPTEEEHHELKLSRHIAAAKPGHLGLKHVRTIQESRGRRGHTSTYGWRRLLFRSTWIYGQVPSHWIGLPHNECNVIHTDLKPENVLAGLEKSLSLDDIVDEEIKSPSPRKLLVDRTIYLSRNDFGHPKTSPGRPKICDFDAAVLPNCYRAPEVILGAPWSYPADIWNLGAMLWSLLEGEDLFDGSDPAYHGEYTSRAHLAQLIGLLGSPPQELLARGIESGLHFNASGQFKAPSSIPSRTFFDTVTTIGGEEKEQFLRFASRMLQWLRATARELLDDPWIRSFAVYV